MLEKICVSSSKASLMLMSINSTSSVIVRSFSVGATCVSEVHTRARRLDEVDISTFVRQMGIGEQEEDGGRREKCGQDEENHFIRKD